MPSYKLYYFDARAVGEVVRQIFAVAGVEYEDVRIPKDKWLSEYKPKFPFGQVPILEVDGKFIPQSTAIARYLAKQFGLAGKDDFDAAWVDAIADQFKDYYAEFSRWYYVHFGFLEGDKETTKKEFGEPARDKFYPLLVGQLKKSNSGFLVGNSLSFIDLLIAEHVATLRELFQGFLDEYPEVLAHSEKIRSIPAVKAWIEKRPKNDM